MQKRNRGCILVLALISLSGLGLIAGVYLWPRYRGKLIPHPLPPPTAPPHFTRPGPWPTPPVAEGFDFPLLPARAYGPYVQGVTGPLAVDTRYGVQNPAMAEHSNCFRDVSGDNIPFSQLYHAGVDLFALDDAGQVAWGQATHAPVHAVADGVVVFTLDAGGDGHIVAIEHLLADGSAVYSIYWHVGHVQVQAGQPVARGQAIAVVYDMGFNSHLHWEMRTFRDGSNMFPPGTAGTRGTCNGHVVGVGYTWDDDPARAHPDYYGYLDPAAFVESHRYLDTFLPLCYAYLVKSRRETRSMAMAIDILLERQQVPTTGILTVQVNQAVQINVSAEDAQRKVSVFALRRISNLMHGETPTLILGERACWRVPVHLTFPTAGDVGPVGSIDVDVSSGELYITPDIIAAIEAHAQAIAQLTP